MSITEQGSTKDKRVVIIGGGITGLAAAHELTKNNDNVSVVVLEGSNKCTGWLETTRKTNGDLIEGGPRSFRSAAGGAYTLTLCEELGILGQLRPSDKAAAKKFIFLNGRMNQVTLWFVIKTIGICNLIGEFFNFGKRRAIPDTDETVTEFFVRRFQTDRIKPIIRCIVRGIFAGDPDVLSIASAFPSIKQCEESSGSLIWAGIKSLFYIQVSKPVFPVSLVSGAVRELQNASTMYNFEHGMQTLPDILLGTLRKNPKVEIRVNSLVGKIRTDGKSKVSVGLITGEDVPCDAIISTISPYYLSPIVSSLSSAIPNDIALGKIPRLLSSIPMNSLILVTITGPSHRFQIPASLRSFGFLTPDGPLLGCTFNSCAFPHTTKPDRASLTCMVEKCDEDIIALAKKMLAETANVLINDDPESADCCSYLVQPRDRCIPQYLVDHGKTISSVKTTLLQYNIAVAGVAIRGPGVNDSLLSGRDAAQDIKTILSLA
eukprot:TRINITY_DN4823_c1_g3_i1.p1 TRINITY_DN4823_c1_g3~~TRINITY_DN4823_c1_g3_i1.p1  ORF type:complete len:505 (+),score=67.78 TRINITY_DN4823_c1_g3_i1:49-1515(+)